MKKKKVGFGTKIFHPSVVFLNLEMILKRMSKMTGKPATLDCA
jgi:hypothetical protein